MKSIVILGAGLSSNTLIEYLLQSAIDHDYEIVVADSCFDNAQTKIAKHPKGKAVKFDVMDEFQLSELVRDSDIVISMLPAHLHHLVAKHCVFHGKHLITPSYISDEMRKFDALAQKAGVLLLNEMGVDPGIDHMSAMKVIDQIKEQGGKIFSFTSSTGGLIAPKYDNNPWNYKFTWNPRNVVLAGKHGAKYIDRGMHKYIPYHKLFDRISKASIDGYGDFEIYPNRDSLKYRDIYDLNGIPTIFRGTIRRPGFCKAWNALVQLGITDDSYIIENSENLTYRDFLNSFLRYDRKLPVEQKAANYLGIEKNSEIIKKLEWLGLFENETIGVAKASPAQIVLSILQDKWGLDPGDTDMIVMQHIVKYKLNDENKKIVSSMVFEGLSSTQTAMSITVGLPVGIAANLILNKQIDLIGVKTPIHKQIYDPILKELNTKNIRFNEQIFPTNPMKLK